MNILRKIWDFWLNRTTLKLKLVVIGVVLLVILAVWLFFHLRGNDAPTIDEKLIQEQQQEIERRESEKLQKNIDKSNEVLANASNAARQAESNTKEATNKDFTNTSLTESEKARCRAYPQGKGCPKQ